ncbi:MAG: ATP-grasp domain-containing protein [Rubripirellula sp.]|nr:ATP-grasp domain-containing protein [Rubripirellula sp.]
MRIMVGEFVCGGGLAQQQIQEIPTSLRLEGAAMLGAVATDLSAFAEVVVPLDPRFSDVAPESAHVVSVDPQETLWGNWIKAAEDCDAAVVIAPESDGMLAKGVAMLRAGGVNVIAGSGGFLRVASDKELTAKRLLAAGVAHPPFMTLAERKNEADLEGYDRYVVKPRDGCGTQEIQTFDSLAEARACLESNLILQAWVVGRPISVAMLATASDQIFLPAVAQVLTDGTCDYAGGKGPLNEEDQRRATALASRAAAAMPPTVRGFVGFDLILGESVSDDYVIEVNPRLTTSYVGLRRMINGNLAARLFEIETGPVSCCTSVDSVRWTPDGRVWINDAVAEPG